jgi:hypothetical protein
MSGAVAAGLISLGGYLLLYAVVGRAASTWSARWPGPIRDFNERYRNLFGGVGPALIVAGLLFIGLSS